jgi:drug/metabolite transporter (DMT)-like permease
MPSRSNHTQTKLAIASLICAGLSYASYGIWSRFTQDFFGPYFQGVARMMILVLVLGIFIIFKKISFNIQPKDRKHFFLIFLMLSIVTPFYYNAVTTLPLGTAIFLFYAGSITTSFILGIVLYKEKISIVNIISVILAIIGIIMIFKSQLQFSSIYNILSAIIAGIFFGAYTSTQKLIKTEYNPMVWQFWGAIQQIFLYTPMMFFTHETNNLVFPSIAWIGAGIFAVAEFISVSLVNFGFRNLEVKKASLLLLSEILFSIVFGFIFYDEKLGVFTIIGGIFIIIGMTIPNIEWKK